MITINSITASVECGGCGCSMTINVDAAQQIHFFNDLPELIESEVGGGLNGGTSVQADLALCTACTKLVDSIGEEDYLPTDDEILRKLNMKDG